MSGRVERTVRDGRAAEVLAVDDATLTLLPEVGLLGSSWRVGDHELLHADVAAAVAGHTTGLPLLHPWANRLSALRYRAAGVDVVVPPEPPVHLFDGLAIHGTLVGRGGWVVTDREAGADHAATTARFVFDDPALLASFPFPHTIEVRHVLRPRRLEVTTVLHADSGVAVPVSFGWHPYLLAPGALPGRRAELEVGLAAGRHLVLDEAMIPTGRTAAQGATTVGLGTSTDPDAVTFDDAYRVDGPGSRLAVSGPAGGLVLSLVEGYGWAQVYAPAGEVFVCLEPMTAPVDALVAGAAAVVPPGGTHRARFGIEVSLAAR